MALSSVFSLWLGESLGLVVQSRVTASAVKIGVGLAAMLVVINVIIALRLHDLCLGAALPSGSELNIAIWVLFGGGAFFFGVLIVNRTMNMLYAAPMFDCYGFGEKFRFAGFVTSAALAFIIGLGAMHVLLLSNACGLTLSTITPFLAGAAGLFLALTGYLVGMLARVGFHAGARRAPNFWTRCDLGLRSGLTKSRGRFRRGVAQGNPKAKAPYPLWRSLWIMFISQLRIMSASRLNVAVFVLGLLICLLALTGMVVQNNSEGAAIAASVASILIFEGFSAPGLAFDARSAFSGRRFSRNFALFTAPFIIVAGIGAFIAALIAGASLSIIGIWAVTAGYIALRYILRLAFFESPMAAMRVYTAIIVACFISYQILGPLGLVWLLALPPYFYRRARKRVQQI